jgi:hypothetical protein
MVRLWVKRLPIKVKTVSKMHKGPWAKRVPKRALGREQKTAQPWAIKPLPKVAGP